MAYKDFCAGLLLLELADNNKGGLCKKDMESLNNVTCWQIKRRFIFPKIIIRKTKTKRVKKYTPLIFLSFEEANNFLTANKNLITLYFS